MNGCESYSLGLVLTHCSESHGGVGADWMKQAGDRAGLGNEKELAWAEQGKGM